MNLPFLTAEDVAARLDFRAAADALEATLAGGLDPEAEAARTILQVGAGDLLVMPSVAGGHATVKLVTVGGQPRIQGICVVFDSGSLAPVALIDGVALTVLRTAAVSLLAIRLLAPREATRAVIFGNGPQAHAHARALPSIRPITHTALITRGGQVYESQPQRGQVQKSQQSPESLVAAADIICCCTTAREPLFDGATVSDQTTVVAIGSHERAARETDDALARRATVVVESRASALSEAGDLLAAIDSGALRADALVTFADLVTGRARVDPARPRLFKSTGMAWEDAAVAAALVRSGRG